jgi:hypothetical protein
MASKGLFIEKVTNAVMVLAQTQELIEGLAGVFTVRGYFAGGGDPITDEDLQAAGVSISAEQFNNIVVPLLGDYLGFCSNVALAAKDRKADMNLARKDL